VTWAAQKSGPLFLSKDSYNQDGADILVAAITSNTAPRSFIVPVDTSQLDEGVMNRASVVRADKIFSIGQSIDTGKV
jgi:mRNA-degrading endonuclease toxin of MazEF toxin-antitoxin module